MRDAFLVLAGGLLIAAALALWLIPSGADTHAHPTGSQQMDTGGKATAGRHRRLRLAASAALAAAGVDMSLVYGIGTPSPPGTGITAELGFAMMLLAVVWFIFRQDVVRYQLRMGALLYGAREPADTEQVRAAETVGAFIRLLFFLPGLFLVLVKLILR